MIPVVKLNKYIPTNVLNEIYDVDAMCNIAAAASIYYTNLKWNEVPI